MFVFVFVMAVLLVTVAAAAAVVAARRRCQRQASAEWGRWEQTARTLSWRDRFELFRATTQGRAVSRPELAALAVQRCEATTAMIENLDLTPWSRWRLGIAVFVVAGGVANITLGMITNSVSGLAQGIWLVALAYFLSPSVQKKTNQRLLAQLRRSAEANGIAQRSTPGV